MNAVFMRRLLAHRSSTRLLSTRRCSIYLLRVLPFTAMSTPPLPNQWPVQQQRQFSNLQSGNPFRVLGVAINSSFAVVRRAFVQLALEHHPDSGGRVDDFCKIRQAFEDIQAGESGGSDNGQAENHHHHSPTGWTPDELREWYREETGVNEFSSIDMDESTRQEVIKVYKTMSFGGKAKGGYWDLARQLTEEEHLRGRGEDNEPVKLLGGSKPSDPSIRRRRKRS